MANRLKDIFSNSLPEYETTLHFRDNDAYRRFRSALDVVENDGSVMAVDGIESISLYVQDHGIKFPIGQHTDISHFMVGPAVEKVPISVIWNSCEKTYQFKRYQIADGVVLETEKNAVVYLKLVFVTSTEQVRITYQVQFQYAKSIEEIGFEIKACIVFLSRFIKPTAESGLKEDSDKICKILRFLNFLEGFIFRLTEVERELGTSFSPQELHSLTGEDQLDVEELYLLLCKKVPLRLNAKLTSTNATNIEIINTQKELAVGSNIAIVFVREVAYDLLGQRFSIFTANALINAIIKDFLKDGEKSTFYYGDTDSRPMYIAYTAYLEEEQAKQEAEINIAGKKEYIEALTGVQYVKRYLEEVENAERQSLTE